MFYQQTKTAKGSAIGTIMPWTGGLTSIPAGWLICDGQSVAANQYPLLAQAIGDTYNAGISDFDGNPPNNFPNYAGNIKLPNLNGKILMDVETSYFTNVGSGGTGRAADIDPDALLLLSPLIGTNEDAGVTTIFTDVYVDLVFNINDNDRTGYQGKIKGNTLVNGDFFQSMYIGPRKLGRSHIKRHAHTGTYETLDNRAPAIPGAGVIPYADVAYTLLAQGVDNKQDDDAGDTFYFGWTSDLSYRGDGDEDGGNGGTSVTYANEKSDVAGGIYAGAGYIINQGVNQALYALEWPYSGTAFETGFETGTPGKVIAKVLSEQPPINLKANQLTRSPLTRNFLTTPEKPDGRYISGNVPFGVGALPVAIPPGYKNYYTLNDNIVGDTLLSNPGANFTSDAADDRIFAHSHDEFDIEFDSTRMKPQSNLTASVNLPQTVTLDNVANRNALQIDFNIQQPRVTSIYIIRAY